MALDHIGLGVKNFTISRAFYEKALAPLGLGIIASGDTWGFIGEKSGKGGGDLWFGEYGTAASPIHIAFAAPSKEAVDAFHKAALEAGGSDNGAPGYRNQYHPGYYGAFVLDPDGHNIEAVFHDTKS